MVWLELKRDKLLCLRWLKKIKSKQRPKIAEKSSRKELGKPLAYIKVSEKYLRKSEEVFNNFVYGAD